MLHSYAALHAYRLKPISIKPSASSFPFELCQLGCVPVRAVAYLQSLALLYMLLRIVTICNYWSSMLCWSPFLGVDVHFYLSEDSGNTCDCIVSSVFQKRYLAVGPDAVLTSSSKDTSANRLYPSLPSSARKPNHGAASPKKTLRKTPLAGPPAALPPVPSASAAPGGSSAAVPSTIPASAAAPISIPAAASEIPAAQPNISSSSAAGAAAGDGVVMKKKRVAIAADSPVRPASASEELDADSAGLPDAARPNGQRALGSGSSGIELHTAMCWFDTDHNQSNMRWADLFHLESCVY